MVNVFDFFVPCTKPSTLPVSFITRLMRHYHNFHGPGEEPKVWRED